MPLEKGRDSWGGGNTQARAPWGTVVKCTHTRAPSLTLEFRIKGVYPGLVASPQVSALLCWAKALWACWL